jgi:NADPH:quinone reductase-like Zn-dependent oxidoreductase
LVDSIGLYGSVVIWCRMGGEPSPINNIPIIFTGKSLHGFWIVNWLKVPRNTERLAGIYEELAPLVASGAISLPIVGEFDLDQYVEALALAAKL